MRPRELVEFTTIVGDAPLSLALLFARPLDEREYEHAAALLLQLRTRFAAWTQARGDEPPAGRAVGGHIANLPLGPLPPIVTLQSRPTQHGVLRGVALDLDRAAALMLAALERAAERAELPPPLGCRAATTGAIALRHRPTGATRVVIEFGATPPIIVGGLDLQRATAGVASAQLAASTKRRSPIVAATVVAETAAEAWTHAAAIVAGGAAAIERAVRAGISRAVMVAHDGAVLLYPAVGEPSDTPFLRAD